MAKKIKPTGPQPVPIAPPKAEKDTEDYRAEAMILLDVKQEDLDASPKIEHLFRGIGGVPKVMEYLSGSEEPEARLILGLAAKLSGRQRQAVDFEAYCLAAKITPKKMFGIISAEVADQSERAAALINKASRWEVVEATVTSAKTPLGVKDREMLHKANQFLPTPKNTFTLVRGDQVNDNRQQIAVAVLPPLEDGIKRSSNRFNEIIAERVKALPAAVEVADLLDEEEEE